MKNEDFLKMKTTYDTFFAMAKTEGVGSSKIYGFWKSVFLLIPLLPFLFAYFDNTIVNITLIIYSILNLIFIVIAIQHIKKYFSFDINPFDYVSLQFSFAIYTILVFGLTYFVFFRIDSQNFSGRISGSNIIDFIYFSFVTITTLGYGDIVPNSNYIKIIVIVELSFGVWFLVTIIPQSISLQANRLYDFNKKRRRLLEKIRQDIADGKLKPVDIEDNKDLKK
jgi:hypothetical protein